MCHVHGRTPLQYTLHDNVYYSTQVGMAAGSGFKARDLFAKVDMPGSYSSAVPFNAMLEATSILMLKLTPL
jgi:hypothetical protein